MSGMPAALRGRVAQDGDMAVVEPEALAEVLRFLRYEAVPAYDALVDLTATDNLRRDATTRFSLHYSLRNSAAGAPLRLAVPCDGGPLPSAIALWPAADWFEREAYDLFGIEFSGRGEMRRLLLPADFGGHPLRKDYPLGGAGEGPAAPPPPTPTLEPLSEEGEIAVFDVHTAGGGLRVQVEVEGERVRAARPDPGYVHAGLEKLGESLTYGQCAQLAGRIGAQSSFSGELALALAIERLMGVEPPPKAVYLRAIWCELGRMASHMAWLAEQAELAGSVAAWHRAWAERDRIRALFDGLVPGAAAGLICAGGTAADLEPVFAQAAGEICSDAAAFIEEIDQLFTGHPFWERRARGLGEFDAATALAWGASGPVLRAAGVDRDLRRGAAPYGELDLAVAVGERGDVYDRCRVRLAEIAASAGMVGRAMAGLPDGPHRLVDRRFVGGDVATPEGMAHHFALWMDGHGLQPPAGEIYCGVEAPGGELGLYLVSDGTDRPYRLRFRTPSFAHFQCYPQIAAGLDLDEAALVLGSLGIAAAEVDR